jgi:SAM-dependent methyltransferase
MTLSVCSSCAHALQWEADYACCSRCNLWHSRLPPSILDEAAWRQLDETARGTALQSLRVGNFRLLLQQLATLRGHQRGTLLDIGAAHGWFVQQAALAGYASVGLEPDPRLVAYGNHHGAKLIEGFFPQALTADSRFDVLVFNDVFEHLPTPQAALQACAQHLQPGGMLVLNLPLATGFFFRLAGWLRRLGLHGPWQRMWQVGFPSPHLHFFAREHLEVLAGNAGFTLLQTSTLPSMTLRGLWARLRMDHQQPVAIHAAQWLLLCLLSPVLGLLPADIGLLIFKKD